MQRKLLKILPTISNNKITDKSWENLNKSCAACGAHCDAEPSFSGVFFGKAVTASSVQFMDMCDRTAYQRMGEASVMCDYRERRGKGGHVLYELYVRYGCNNDR